MSAVLAAGSMRTPATLGLLIAVTLLFVVASHSHAASSSSHPRLHWSRPKLIDPPVGGSKANLNDLSCASGSFCVAVDQLGNAVASTDPRAGTWRVTSADAGVNLAAVSCPSSSLCAASGGHDLITSTDPGAASPTWTVASVDPQAKLLSIACPSKRLCVAADDGRHVLTSTNPTGGPGAWKSVTVSRKLDIASISCPSGSLCAISGVQYGSGSYVATSTDPTAGSWKFARFGGGGGVSCPSKSFCAAATLETNMVVSKSPTGGKRAWKRRSVNGGPGFNNGHHLFYDVSCPTKSLCVAGGGDGYLARSSRPLHRPSTWKARVVNGLAPGDRGFFYAIACPSDSLCLAGDRAGYATVGTG